MTMQSENSHHTPAFTALLTQVITTLEEFDHIQLRLDPGRISEYQGALEPLGNALSDATQALLSEQQGEQLSGDAGRLLRTASYLLKAMSRFKSAAPGRAGIQNAFLSLRSVCRATEELYPFAEGLQLVNRFFLDSSAATEVRSAMPTGDGPDHGVIHADNARGQRGGYSLYVPEYYTSDRDWPLVIACHGGSGHGADFLWSWVREARSHGVIVLAPTSQGRTWSLGPPYTDVASLEKLVENMRSKYRIDGRRVLLSGISDGGTFALLNALLERKTYTHYAPIASAIHAFATQREVLMRLKGVPIYQVHGRMDWMFPISLARAAKEALDNAGAKLVYREIEDLSHNYPRDENRAIIEWLRLP